MVTEMFFDLHNISEKQLIKNAMKSIAVFQKQVPTFEPDPRRYTSIKLKRANFEEILS